MAVWYKKHLDKFLQFLLKVKQELTPSNRTIRKVKIFCYKVLAMAGVLLLAYTYGTFNPNSIVTKKIIKQGK